MGQWRRAAVGGIFGGTPPESGPRPDGSRPRPVTADRAAGVVRGVVLAREGAFHTPGRGRFDRDALKEIVRLANAAPGGLRSRLDHPARPADDVGRFLGRVRDARLDTAGPVWAARADLWLDPAARRSPAGDLHGYVLALADNDPDALAMSLSLTSVREARADGGPPLWVPVALDAADVVDSGDATDGLAGGRAGGLPPARPPAPLLTGTLLHFGRRAEDYVVLDPAGPRGLSRAVYPVFLPGSVSAASGRLAAVTRDGRVVAPAGGGLAFGVDGDRVFFTLPVATRPLRGVADLIRLRPGSVAAELRYTPVLADVAGDELRVGFAGVDGVDLRTRPAAAGRGRPGGHRLGMITGCRTMYLTTTAADDLFPGRPPPGRRPVLVAAALTGFVEATRGAALLHLGLLRELRRAADLAADLRAAGADVGDPDALYPAGALEALAGKLVAAGLLDPADPAVADLV